MLLHHFGNSCHDLLGRSASTALGCLFTGLLCGFLRDLLASFLAGFLRDLLASFLAGFLRDLPASFLAGFLARLLRRSCRFYSSGFRCGPVSYTHLTLP